MSSFRVNAELQNNSIPCSLILGTTSPHKYILKYAHYLLFDKIGSLCKFKFSIGEKN